jgi:hypothetical protein
MGWGLDEINSRLECLDDLELLCLIIGAENSSLDKRSLEEERSCRDLLLDLRLDFGGVGILIPSPRNSSKENRLMLMPSDFSELLRARFRRSSTSCISAVYLSRRLNRESRSRSFCLLPSLDWDEVDDLCSTSAIHSRVCCIASLMDLVLPLDLIPSSKYIDDIDRESHQRTGIPGTDGRDIR